MSRLSQFAHSNSYQILSFFNPKLRIRFWLLLLFVIFLLLSLVMCFFPSFILTLIFPFRSIRLLHFPFIFCHHYSFLLSLLLSLFISLSLYVTLDLLNVLTPKLHLSPLNFSISVSYFSFKFFSI